jgi:hypothetical protein
MVVGRTVGSCPEVSNRSLNMPILLWLLGIPIPIIILLVLLSR